MLPEKHLRLEHRPNTYSISILRAKGQLLDCGQKWPVLPAPCILSAGCRCVGDVSDQSGVCWKPLPMVFLGLLHRVCA